MKRSIKKQCLFLLLAGFLVLAFLEFAFHLLCLASPNVDRLLSLGGLTRVIPDDQLGSRPNPDYPGHDSNGFRNEVSPTTSEIVALGDSQTYGAGVEAREAWPKQLASITEKSVYSMAFGGYGPGHSLVLWDEAIALKPDMIIEAFYAGNDLYDAYTLVYKKGGLPELMSQNDAVREKIEKAERAGPIEERISQTISFGKPATVKTAPQKFLSEHSMLYGLARRIRHELKTRKQEALDESPQKDWADGQSFAKAHPDWAEVIDTGVFRTVLTPAYRLAALDLEDPRIKDGSRIALDAIQRMSESASARDIQFLVLLIPTKELVFRDVISNPSSDYLGVIANEKELWKTTKEFLDRSGIEYLDTLPALQKRLKDGIQPYKSSDDGHPNADGHAAIAELVASRLEKQ